MTVTSILFLLCMFPYFSYGKCENNRCFVPGELVIKYKDSAMALSFQEKGASRQRSQVVDSLKALGARFGARESKSIFKGKKKIVKRTMSAAVSTTFDTFDPTRYEKIIFPPEVNLDEVIAAYKEDPNIEFAEPNYFRNPIGEVPSPDNNIKESASDAPTKGILSLPDDTTDPEYHRGWHLDTINAPQAWQFLEDHGINPGGSRDVIIAIIDTGVDYTHPDLGGNMWINTGEIPGDGQDNDGNGFIDDIYGVNVVAGTGDPDDNHGHGTHVAGIAAAQANNGAGSVGVAFNSQIMAIKAAQYSGVLTTTDIAQGILYAVEKGADVINMSFGGYFQSQIEEDALSVAFGQAVLVAAAGNDAKNNEVICNIPASAMYPAAYPWVLGVMASGQSPDLYGDWLASFSNRDIIPENSIEYNLMAPGSGIYSTLPGNQYAAWSGTSMSTPVVAGMAALVRSYFSDKDMYSSRFIMGQIAPTGPILQGYTPPCAPPISYHMADAYAALATTPKPKLTTLDHWVFDDPETNATNDADGRVDAGETVDLAITIRNHWGKANNVQVTLRAWNELSAEDDPYVTLDIPTVDYGAVGSFNIDDNGFIYDDNSEIIGVEHPFRFTVSPDCPNNHVIPIHISMTANNGFDAGDPGNPYTFTSSFKLVVQRGVELPRFIAQDMTLTSENYYIVPDSTLVNEGVTLTIQEGTQIQFWSSEAEDPYSTQPDAKIVVAGTLLSRGTAENPVKMFPSSLHPDRFVVIQADSGGVIDLQYARVTNPYIEGAEVFDHCYFDQDSDVLQLWRSSDERWIDSNPPMVLAASINYSIFHKLGTSRYIDQDYYAFDIFETQNIRHSLFDSCRVEIKTDYFYGNALLKNYKLFWDQWGNRLYGISKIISWGPAVDSQISLRGVFSQMENGRTYWLASPYFISVGDTSGWNFHDTSQKIKFLLSESFANTYGGHICAINDETENTFVRNFLQSNQNEISFNELYPDLEWYKYSNFPVIGLVDFDSPGDFQWTSGESLSYTNWRSDNPSNPGDDTVQTIFDGYSGEWYQGGDEFNSTPILMEIPNAWTQAQIDEVHEEKLLEALSNDNRFKNNAILNCWQDPDPAHWLNLEVSQTSNVASNWYTAITDNYWGTQSTTLIDTAIKDFQDDFVRPQVIYQPILTTPPEDCYPFVTDVVISIEGDPDVSVVGAEAMTFHVSFNRDMDTDIAPQVSFGPDLPETDYTVHPIQGGWVDPRNWQGTFNITPVTGDGYQFIRVASAVAADDPWLVTGDDSERFRFEIITSGTESMNLQATGGEGFVDLMWSQDDFELLSGFQMYRSTTIDGTYNRISPSIISPEIRTYRDMDVQPGQSYFYKFTIVKSDMTESDFSNVATATPTDTISPVITHTPITTAATGLALTLTADVTDNVGVQQVLLYYRHIGETDYLLKQMVNTIDTRFAASIEGSYLVSPGIEYYLEASDGISAVRSGRPEFPRQIMVVDQPVITAVNPANGPSSGGTMVTLAGSNFKASAAVTFGGASAASITVVSSNQITCTTPAHFPETVDVRVTNPDDQYGMLLQSFTFQSDVVSMGIPDTSGGQNEIVHIPINIANVEGLAAASLTTQFDPAILQAVEAEAGTLTPGWSISANTTTPGQVRISMASSGGAASGSGTLAVLTFEIIGAPATQTALQLSGVSLNDGAIPVEISDGSIGVNQVFDVSGAVQFWNGAAGVPGTLMTTVGERIYTALSDETGVYSVTGLPSDTYTVTPSKSDNTDGISAYDASLALQHDAGIITLSGSAAIAGDVNKNESITAMDAYYILQRSVGLIDLPFNGAGIVWQFDPMERNYPALSENKSNENYSAILIGDISGNWNSPGSLSFIEGEGTAPLLGGQVSLSLPNVQVRPNGQTTLSALLENGSETFTSANIEITYDSSVVSFVSVTKGEMISAWNLAENHKTPGLIQIGLAGAIAVDSDGELFRLTFSALGDNGNKTDLSFAGCSIDEGQITPVLNNGALEILLLQGDINGDCIIDLTDVILTLKLMTDNPAGEEIYNDASLSANGKIGSVDVIHQLQVIGETEN